MQKIRRIVESQAKIPRIIIIKDQYGVEQEYEVLEESEEEENSVQLSMSRDGEGGLMGDRGFKVINKGVREENKDGTANLTS